MGQLRIIFGNSGVPLTKYLRCREAIWEERLVVRAASCCGSHHELGRVDGGDVSEKIRDLGCADAGTHGGDVSQLDFAE